MNLYVHQLNTGWNEDTPSSSFVNEGKHTAIPGGALRPHGWSDQIRRADGTVTAGTMVPTFVWYIGGGEKHILVDTGMGPLDEVLAALDRRDIHFLTLIAPEDSITAQLAQLDLTPDDIDVVIHTHLHFDHCGNDELFKNAVFLVNGDELTWALAPPPYGMYYWDEASTHVRAVMERTEVIRGDYQVSPGVRILRTGGHSPGHCVVLVETNFGRVMIGGDAAYNYRNLEYEWPQGVVFNMDEYLSGLQTLKTADIILLAHDALSMELFSDGVVGTQRPSEDARTYMKLLRTKGAFDMRAYRESGPSAPFAALPAYYEPYLPRES